MRSLSKSTENLKQMFTFLQPNSSNGSTSHRSSASHYQQEDDNGGIGLNTSSPSSRSISYESSMINPWRTENSMLKSLLQRIITDLNIDTTSEYHAVLNSSDRFLSIDMMLELQTQVLSSIQKLKQKANPFTISNHIHIDDEDLREEADHRESDLEKDDLPNLFRFEWRNCLEIHAPPPFDLDSPVVQHIFDTWTTDDNKISFLKNWILNLSTKNYDAVPIGIQITNISQVLRDAFIMLIVPIMRRRSVDPLEVMLRERFLHSLPPIDAEVFSSTNTTRTTTVRLNQQKQPSSPSSPSLNADPFVTPEHSVFDIRIKRVIPHVDAFSLSPTISPSNGGSSKSITAPNQINTLLSPGKIDQFHEINSHSPSNLASATTGLQGNTTKTANARTLSPHRISSTSIQRNLKKEDKNINNDNDDDSVHSKEEFPITDLFASLH